MRPFGLIEMVRTGEIAISRGRSADLATGGDAHAQRESPFGLSAAARRGCAERVARGVRPAARTGAGELTVPVPADLDLTAAVLAARRPDDRFFCFEQPDRDGFALAGAGRRPRSCRRAGRGASRRWPRQCRRWAVARIARRRRRRAGAVRPRVGRRLRVRRRRRASPEWRSLAPAQLVMPEVALARHGGEARMAVTVAVPPARGRGRVWRAWTSGWPSCARVDAAARPRPGRGARGWPAPRRRSTSSRPSRGRSSGSRAGELTKVVLAREVRVHAPAPIDPAPVSTGCAPASRPASATSSARPSSPSSALARSCWRAARAQRVQTVALAGTRRRSADPSVDDHLGEQLLQSREGPRGAGDRHAPDQAHAGPGERLGHRGRRARAREGA